jgi:hypothetical protein
MRFSVFLLSILTLSSLSAQAAAPLCQGTFLDPQLVQSMEPLIRDLAKMKLQIDTLKVESNASGPFELGTLTDRYPKLLAKIIEQGSYSEAHLKSLIRTEIQRHQDRKNEKLAEESSKESSRRATEQEIILAPVFGIEKESIVANQTAVFAKDNSFYVDRTDKLTFVANGSYKASLLHGQSAMSVPAEAMTPALNGTAMYLKRSRLLMTLSTATGRMTSSDEISFVSDLSIHTEFNSLQLNNDGSLLLMKGTEDNINSVLSVLDVSKKKEIFFNEKIQMKQITDATFLETDVLAIVNSHELRLVQVSTGKEIFQRDLNIPGSSPEHPTQVHLSNDKKHLIISNDQAIQSLSVSKLDGDGVTITDSSEIKRRRIYTIPSMPDSFVEVNGSGARIINATNLNVEFSFEKKYQSRENKVMAIAPTLDGEKLVVIYWPDPAERMNVRVDIWKKL